MFLIQRCSRIFRFSKIPKYVQTELPRPKDITMPNRPKLDPEDPYEKYEQVRPEEFVFRGLQENAPEKRFYPGTQFVSVHRNGKSYHLFDASRMPYGKMVVRIAQFLNGKHKPIYRQNETGFGDQCIVVNASNPFLTGRKLEYKVMTYHTGYIGHLRKVKFSDMFQRKPEQLIAWSVSKMLPKNKNRFEKLDNLHVFRDREHTFTDVLPQILPHQVDFEYNGNLAQDIQESSGTVIYSTVPPESEQFKNDVGNMKVDLIDDADLNDEVFTPFVDRNYKVRKAISQKEYDKLVRRRLHIMKRYKRRSIKAPRQLEIGAKENMSYLVTKTKDLRRLNLVKVEDDEPELEEETLKM